MLVLSVKVGRKVFIGKNREVLIEVLRVKGDRASLGFTAPRETPITRDEPEPPETTPQPEPQPPSIGPTISGIIAHFGSFPLTRGN